MTTRIGPTKCPVCGEFFRRDREPSIEYKKRYYHEACFETLDSSVHDRVRLEQYIIDLRGYSEIPKGMKDQITRLTKKGFTLSGILGSLVYYHEVLNKPVKMEYGIGIVEHVYEDARAYYSREKVKHSVNDNFTGDATEITDLKINRPPEVKNLNKMRKMIDMEDI